jgi:hypothetical protein
MDGWMDPFLLLYQPNEQATAPDIFEGGGNPELSQMYQVPIIIIIINYYMLIISSLKVVSYRMENQRETTLERPC